MLWIPCFEIFKSRRSSSLKIPCGKKFLRVLIFAIFAVFPAIHKNKFPQIKIIAHTFSAKIISRVNILQLKFTTQKCSTTKSCLSWQSQLASFTQKQLNTGLLLENMYFYCTYSIKTKILYQCWVQNVVLVRPVLPWDVIFEKKIRLQYKRNFPSVNWFVYPLKLDSRFSWC